MRFILGIILGIVGGAVLGLVIAPKSGRETREALRNRVRSTAEEAEAVTTA